MKKILFSLAAILLFGAAFAQEDSKSFGNSSFFFNVTQPVGFFHQNANLEYLPGYPAMTRSDIASDAIIGIGGTYRYSYAIEETFGDIVPYLEASFYWNNIRRDNRRIYEDCRASIPNYFNIPFLAGLSYRHPITPSIKAYGEFGLGYDWFFISREGNKDNVNDFRYSTHGAMTWQLGAGIFYGKKLSAGIYFVGFGRHLIDYSNNSKKPIAEDYLKAKYRNIGSLMLRLGFHLDK